MKKILLILSMITVMLSYSKPAEAQSLTTNYYQLYDGKTSDFHMFINDTSIDITMDSIYYHVVIDSVVTDFWGVNVYYPQEKDYYGTFLIFTDYIGVSYDRGFREYRIIYAFEEDIYYDYFKN